MSDIIYRHAAVLERELFTATNRIAELEAALEPFAKAADTYAGLADTDYIGNYYPGVLTVGDLRRAARARPAP